MLTCLGKSKCKYEYNTVEELNNKALAIYKVLPY